MVTELHWDFDRVDATPWPEVVSLCDYWDWSPPTHVAVKMLLQAYTTWKAKRKEPTRPLTHDTMMELNMTGLFSSGPEKLPPHLRHLIDVAEEMKKKMPGLS
jgi:hypothetical protein